MHLDIHQIQVIQRSTGIKMKCLADLSVDIHFRALSVQASRYGGGGQPILAVLQPRIVSSNLMYPAASERRALRLKRASLAPTHHPTVLAVPSMDLEPRSLRGRCKEGPAVSVRAPGGERITLTGVSAGMLPSILRRSVAEVEVQQAC